MMEKKLDGRRSRSALGVLLCTMALSALILLGAAVVRADTVLDWNITALKTTAAAPFNPPVESRNLAIVHAAMFDAVNSIIGEFHGYAVEFGAPKGASADAAAAHFALVKLYPERQTIGHRLCGVSCINSRRSS